jgi:hypothetical protein
MKTLVPSVISLAVGIGVGCWFSQGHGSAPGPPLIVASSPAVNALPRSPVHLVEVVKKAPRDEKIRIATGIFLELEEDLQLRQLDLAAKLLAAKKDYLKRRPDIAALERYLEEVLPNWWQRNDPEGLARLSAWLTSGSEEAKNAKSAYESRLGPLFNVIGMARFVLDENAVDAAWTDYRQTPPPASLGKNVFASADKIAGVVIEDGPDESWQARMEKRRAAYESFLTLFSAEHNVPPEVVEALQTKGYVNMAGMMGKSRLDRAFEESEALSALNTELNNVSNRLESVTNTRGSIGLLFQNADNQP